MPLYLEKIVKHDVVEDYNQFKETELAFAHLYDNTHSVNYVPKSLKEWFDEVQNNHQTLRQVLGGVGRDFQIDNIQYLEPYRVCITTAAMAFARIGRYGCDEGSCFAQGNFNGDKKYIFGATPNTFVALIYDGNICVSRWLGFASDDMSVFNFFGHYIGSNSLTQVQCGKVFRECVRLIMDTQSIGLGINKVTVGGCGFYSHPPYYSLFETTIHPTTVPQQDLVCRSPLCVDLSFSNEGTNVKRS